MHSRCFGSVHLRTYVLFLACIATLLVTGCDKVLQEEQPAALTTALSATSTPNPTSCDYGLLAWNLGTPGVRYGCAGGAQYAIWNQPCRHDYPEGDHHCDEVDVHPTHTVARKCDWANNYTNETHHDLVPTRTVTDRVCCDPAHQRCPKPPCEIVTTTVQTTTCTAMAQAARDAYHNGAIYNPSGHRYGASVAIINQGANGVPYCDYTLTHVPVMHIDEPNATLCGVDVVVDPAQQTWPACTRYENNHSCGEVSKTLQFGQNYTDVPEDGDYDTDKTYCLTEEDHSIHAATRAADVLTKYNRLKTRLAETLGKPEMATVRALIVSRMKLLFEMFADQLPAAEREEAMRVYLDYPANDASPTCGRSFAPPDTSLCTNASIGAIAAKLTFCARMQSGHVSPQVRDLDVVKYTCVDVATSIGALRTDLIAAGGSDDGSAPGATSEPNDVCGFKALRAAYDTWVSTPLAARFADPKDPRTSADRPEIQMRLSLMDRWYRALETMYPYAASEPSAARVRKAAWVHAEDMEAALWRGAYRNLFPQAPVAVSDAGAGDSASVAPPFTAEALAALTRDALKADHDMLTLTFTPYTPGQATPATGAPTPLRTAPLLLLVADALEAMHQRIRDVGIYHDMGCAYIGCTNGVDSEIAHLVELLANITDFSSGGLPAALSVAHNLRNESGQPLVRADWLDVFDAIVAHHDAIESALKDALGAGSELSYADAEPLLENGGAQDIPDVGRHLASIVQSTRTANATYKTTGLFNPSARNRLAAGIQQDEVEGLRGDINNRASQLQAAVGTYTGQLSQIANGVIEETGLKAAAVRSTNEIDQKHLQISNIAKDVAGLSNSLEVNEKTFGKFAASYAQVTAFDPNVTLAGATFGPYVFNGASAKAAGPIARGGDVAPAAANTIRQLLKGTIVTINVGGNDKWSPTCALKTAGLPGPTSPGPFGVTVTSPTGPEGYTVAFSNGTFEASKNDTGISTGGSMQATIEGKSCSGTRESAGGELFGNGATVYNDNSLCLSTSATSHTDFTTGHDDSDGTELRSSANFVSGMRLPTTPFPDAPVGALLAAVTRKDHPGVLLELRVVQAPATTIVLPEDADLHLVANDIIDQARCVGDTTYGLTVSVTTARHAGEVLGWVNNGIGNVIQTIRSLAGEDADPANQAARSLNLVSQGRLLPEQEASIRSQAITSLVAACRATSTSDPTSCEPGNLPESVRNFVTAFIDREIERIALKVEIIANLRQMQAIDLDIRQIVDDYNASTEQGRVAELLPRWTLRNLDSELLRAQTSELVDSVTYDLYPVLQLRYAPILASIKSDPVLNPTLMTLVHAQWDAPIVDLANAAVSAALALYGKTTQIKERYPGVEPKFVALSFPRPGKKTTTWLHTDDARNVQVWQAATTGNHVATLRVLPEDLYRAAGGPGVLLCTEEVPVLRDFAVVLAGGGISALDTEAKFNRRPFSLRSFSSPNLTFASAAIFDANHNLYSAGGPLDFEIKSDWTTLDTMVLVSADVADAKAKYDLIRADASQNVNGRGLSPFTDFNIDFSSLYDPAFVGSTFPVDLAEQIVLTMKVEYRRVAADRTMSWIRTCQ